MIATLIPFYLFVIFAVPLCVAIGPLFWITNPTAKMAVLAVSPLVFAVSFVTIAGLLSLPAQKAIVAGKFNRSLKDPVYGPRRLYGICWTAIFYFSPLYMALLAVPALKTFLFRLFGYRGSMDITIYPDVWIRDLPMLKFEKGVYVANKATLGSNMCLSDGKIFVDVLELGENAMVGHMGLVAPGTRMEKNTELGVHGAIGIRSRLQEGTKVGPMAVIYHGVDVGKNCEIGACAYLGLRTKIGEGVRIPFGANIPPGTVIESQTDAERHQKQETAFLNQLREGLSKEFFGENTRPTASTSRLTPKPKGDEAA